VKNDRLGNNTDSLTLRSVNRSQRQHLLHSRHLRDQNQKALKNLFDNRHNLKAHLGFL